MRSNFYKFRILLSSVLFITTFLIIGIETTYAQYPIQVNVQVRQPVSPYLPELMGDLRGAESGSTEMDITRYLQIVLHNTDNIPRNLKLSGRIERISPAPMSISLRPGFAPPKPLMMPPGQMLQANQEVLNQAFGGFYKNDLIFSNTSLSELRQSSMNYKLPEGTYRICISAYDYNKTGMSGPLSAPGTGCATFIICYSASAPQFIMPVSTMGIANKDFQTVTPLSHQIQFNWTAPASTCGLPINGLKYDFKLMRVFQGQSISDALHNPPVFLRENLHTTNFFLDTLRFPDILRDGEKYIFRVRANFTPLPNNPLEIENNGYSQIGTFTYNPTSRDKKIGEDISDKDALPKTETKVRGTLTYQFANDSVAELFPLSNQEVYLKRVYAKTVKDANGITSIVPLSTAEQNSIPPYPDILDGQITQTNENGEFELTVGMTEMDGSGLVGEEEWESLLALQYEGNSQKLSVQKRSTEGLIKHQTVPLDELKGQLVRMYKVEVVNPFFKPSDKYLQISPGGERNVSNIVLEANSYTLRVNVQEVVSAKSGALLNRDVSELKGVFAEGATVKLYRLTRNKTNSSLSIPFYEGDILDVQDWNEVEDKVLIASRTTPSLSSKSDNPDDYAVDFPRLFRNPGGELYDYIVCLENGQGSMRLPLNYNIINDPIIPSNSKIWGTFQNINKSDPNILNNKNTKQATQVTKTPGFPSESGGIVPNLPVMGNPNLPGHGPNGQELTFDYFPEDQGASTSNSTQQEEENSTLEYEHKWSSWSYNGKPDVAYLTLEKELAEPPHSKVTGKLEYKFKGDPSIPAQPYANMPVKLMVFYLMKNEDGTQTPVGDDRGYYNQVVQTYANQDFPEGYSNGSPPADWYSAEGDRMTFENNGQVLQTVYTDAAGNFTFDFENLDSTMQIFTGTLKQYHGYDRTEHFVENIYGSFMRVYRVVPDINQYTAPDDDVPVQPWGEYDCGTLTSFVRTFNMEVAVRAESELLQLNDIPVQLYYNPQANTKYPIPVKPGLDKNKPMEVNGQNYILLRNDMASELKEETFENGLSEAQQANLERLTGKSESRVPDATYAFKTITFKDLVISQSSSDFGRFYLVEAGGFPLEREGGITLNADYLFYPKNLVSENWDKEFAYVYNGPRSLDDHLASELKSLEQNILFNSEYEPDRTVRVYLAASLAKPRIAGRLIDGFTTLGVASPLGSIKLRTTRSKRGRYTSYATGEPVEIVSEDYYTNEHIYWANTNSYGYFEITEYTDDLNNEDIRDIKLSKLIISVPGYKDTIIDMREVMQEGEQLYYDPIVISPKCTGCHGYVVDADNPEVGVAARVKVLKNGRWVDTYPVSENTFYKTGLSKLPGLYINNMLSAGAINTTPGEIDPLYRPNLSQKMSPSSSSNMMKKNYVINMGNLQLKTDDKGDVAHVEIKKGTEKNAGMWSDYANLINGVDFEAYKGNSAAAVTKAAIQRFDLSMPLLSSGNQIVILPYDRSYIPDTFNVNSYADANLGTFQMQQRKHKIRVVLSMKDSRGLYKVPTGAVVSIDGINESEVVDENGEVYFEFVNNSTSNFTLRIRPEQPKFLSEMLSGQFNQTSLNFDPNARGDLDLPQSSEEAAENFVPKTLSFSNEDDNVEHVLRINLEEGASISGTVVFEKDNTPVKNAVVYLDRGQGIQSDIITVTNEEGKYILAGIPRIENEEQILRFGASYSDGVKSYIGDTKDLYDLELNSSIDFQIKEIENIDLTHLFGFPVRLTDVKEDGNKYKVSGEFINLPTNPNFSVSEQSSASTLSFNEVAVTSSSILNKDGVPFAVPIADKITLDNKIYPLKVFGVYNGELTSKRSDEKLEIKRVDSDTNGILNGAVRIVNNSFNFPSSYMTISNTDFYLGNFGVSEPTGENQNSSNTNTAFVRTNSFAKLPNYEVPTISMPVRTVDDRLIIPVFSSMNYPLSKFSLTNIKGEGIHFNYLGFDGTTGNSGLRESYIHGDSVNLYLDLRARIQGGIELNFNAGKAILTHNQMKAISNDDTLNMKLEEWEVMSTSWDLSPNSGGIVLNDGVLNIGLVGLPFTNMTIIPGDPEGELICNSLDASTLKEASDQGKLVLGGGAAEWRLYDNVDITFVYDPDVGTVPGEGHYKFSLHSLNGKVAYFGGLDGMTDPTQRFNIQFLSTLSNGEQLFAFNGEDGSITLYNQIQFKPQNIFNHKDHFTIGGLMAMDVPDMSKNIGLNLRFDYTGKEDIRNELSVGLVDFNFTGNGGSKFKIDMGFKEMQRIEKDVVAFPGIVTLPNTSLNYNANFVSIVYEGAKDPIPATGKVSLAYKGFDSSSFDDGLAENSLPSFKGLSYGDAFYAEEFVPNVNPEDVASAIKTHTEIFIGTSEQLFGEAGKALGGSLSSMQNYGSGTGGVLSDFGNEVYNEAANDINELNTAGRQTFNNLMNQVGSLRMEANKAYDEVSDYINQLRANGEGAYEQTYTEILSQLENLKNQSDQLYDDLIDKRNDFLRYGDEVYHEVYDKLASEVSENQRIAEENLENLTQEITSKIGAFQSYAEGVYGEVLNQAGVFQNMGEELYDDIYNELSTTFNQIEQIGNEVASDLINITNDFRDYGTQLVLDDNESFEDIINKGEEVLDGLMAEANKLSQEAEEAYQQVQNQISNLKAQGKDAYIAAQQEMLEHFGSLKNHYDEIYNELQQKQSEWLQSGQEVIDGLRDDIEDLGAYGKELYDDLYGSVADKADELRTSAEDLYKGVEDEINSLKKKGKEFYDENFGIISDAVEGVMQYGEELYGDAEELLNGFKELGQGIYDDIQDLVSEKIDEIRAFAEGIAEDALNYGKEDLDEVLAGPVGELLDEMNALRNTAEQYIEVGKQKVDSLMAAWPLAGDAIEALKGFDANDIEGSLLKMAGNMVDFEGIKENAKDKLILVANETLEGIKESLEIDNITNSISDVGSSDAFKGMNIDLDLNTGRITGSMYSDFVSFGAVELSKLGIEVLIDTKGWYLYSGAGIDMPTTVPLNPVVFPIGVGFLVGNYKISPSLATRVTQHSYVNTLPSSMSNRIDGLFLTGKKDILKPTSVGINFYIVDFEVGASAGMDARLYANFGTEETEIGLGAMAFADAYARLSVLGCGVSGSASANVGIKAVFVNNAAGSTFHAKACGSVTMSGSAWCIVTASYSESIMALLDICAGAECNKAIDFKLKLGSTCATDNDFDY